jgi:putative DNA primase/helicase
MGDYGRTSDFATFLARDREGVRDDIAELRGARLVSAIEVSEGRRLSEAVIKQLTGGDTIRARFLYQEAFEFKPQFKLWLAANHKPVIRGTDRGLWRRVKLIPFTVEFPKDREFPAKLHAEAVGVLAWAVRGCLDWQAEGLGDPEEVRDATEEYRQQSDTMGLFIEACCVTGEKCSAGATALYDTYKVWCGLNGEQYDSQTKFGIELGNRGFTKDKKGVVTWFGIGIKCEEDSGQFG